MDSILTGMSRADAALLMRAVVAEADARRKKEREQKNPVGSMLRQITHRKDRRGITSPAGRPLMWRP